MKNVIVFFFAFCFINNLAAQSVTFQTIYENQSYQLNSGGRALLGGQSRTYVPIQIPNGAIGIIYTVKSSLNYDAGQNIQLAASLTASFTGHFILANAINRIQMPPSNAVIDVYLLPNTTNNLTYFLNKNDGYWTQYQDYSCPSSLGCKMAVQVSSDMQTLYIALRNPSSINRIVAIVDVVAVMSN